MTQTGYANAIVNALLGWLKGLASWVLRLFNLSGGFSPLKFLADNWLKLLIFFLAVGIVVDLLVWLIRWRPHWVWFRKKRVIINDKNFFAGEKYIHSPEDLDAPKRPAPAARPRRDWEESDFVVRSAASRRRADRSRPNGGRRSSHVKSMQMGRDPQSENRDVFRDDLFNVNAKQKFSDKYEDEVFNVSNLPRPERRVRPNVPDAQAQRAERPVRARKPEAQPVQRSGQGARRKR